MNKSLHSALDLITRHNHVPGDYYDFGIKSNIFQLFWHKNRIKNIRCLLPNKAGVTVDIGSHSGMLTASVLRNKDFRNVICLDISTPALLYGKKVRSGFKWIAGNGESLPLKQSTADCVLCLEILEHVDRPLKVLSELSRILKPGGNAIILVPIETALFRFLWFFWSHFGAGRVWKHVHVQHFTPRTLVKDLRLQKLIVKDRKSFLLGMLFAVRVTKNK